MFVDSFLDFWCLITEPGDEAQVWVVFFLRGVSSVFLSSKCIVSSCLVIVVLL